MRRGRRSATHDDRPAASATAPAPSDAPPGARAVLDAADIERALTRIAHEILERNKGADDVVLLGIPTRGVAAGRTGSPSGSPRSRAATVPVGSLDVTMYRDDLRLQPGPGPASRTEIPAGGVDGKVVVLVDDVLFSGRTVRAALDALGDLGRPARRPAGRARRPRPPRAADPRRLRRQEPPDLAARDGPACCSPSTTAATRVLLGAEPTGGGAA